MNFSEIFKHIDKNDNKINKEKSESKILTEKESISPEEILRSNGLKIKLITPTSFGVQIDFSKKYDENKIKELLKDFNIKIKNNSIFIVL